MTVIRKIPLVTSLLGAVIVCFAGIIHNINFQILCVRVSLVIIVFYGVGLLIKRVSMDLVVEMMLYDKERKKHNIKKNKIEQDKNNGSQYDANSEFSPLHVEKLDDKHDAKIVGRKSEKDV